MVRQKTARTMNFVIRIWIQIFFFALKGLYQKRAREVVVEDFQILPDGTKKGDGMYTWQQGVGGESAVYMTTKNSNNRAKNARKDKEGRKQKQAKDELFRLGGGRWAEEKEPAEIQGGFAEGVFLRWGRMFFWRYRGPTQLANYVSRG